jgi:hypothetical protein
VHNTLLLVILQFLTDVSQVYALMVIYPLLPGDKDVFVQEPKLIIEVISFEVFHKLNVSKRNQNIF